MISIHVYSIMHGLDARTVIAGVRIKGEVYNKMVVTFLKLIFKTGKTIFF